MQEKQFRKSFTQQEPIPEAAIENAVAVLRSGRLHRYNTSGEDAGETAQLEAEYAAYQGASYCLAVTSGGQALQIALRAVGVVPGDQVLANAYTLAPVPGAMHAVGARPVFVEIGPDWCIDTNDLDAKAKTSGAKYLMLSHMRGHIADMERIQAICAEHGITLVEDCAHTMGASWKGIRSGNFGAVACFSAQTYKHINSGEGGLLTTNDPEIAARATMMSGSYMLFDRHGAGPDPSIYDEIRYESANCSARMDNLRAAILRPQLKALDDNIRRWNERYRVLEAGISQAPGLSVKHRPQHEYFVGSSFQFQADGLSGGTEAIPTLVSNCLARGVEIKWFGASQPAGYTSRYDSWRYLDDLPTLPNTLEVLSTTCDIRVPLTFSLDDCRDIAEIVAEEAGALT